MTIVAIWYRKDHGDLYAIADSRLTSNQGVLTDKAPKFFSININCHTLSKSPKSKTFKVLDCAICIGYAGSSMVALSTIATIQPYMSSLSIQVGGSLPKLRDIASFVANILEDNYKSFGSLWGQAAKCDFLIFGALPSDRYLCAFHVSTAVSDGKIVTVVSELNLVQKELCCSFGSASDFFMEKLRKDMNDTKNFHPFNILSAILESGARGDIGGHIQVAIARPGTVTLPHVMTPRPDRGEYAADVTFLGRDVSEIGSIGDCSVGSEAVGPDLPALLKIRKEAGY